MDFLTKILEVKQQEVEKISEEKLQAVEPRPSFYQTVKNDPSRLHVIGEIKRASPSLGDINAAVDILTQARQYQAAGVSGISVLTDEAFFKGRIEDLKAVSQVVSIPLLCKDFIIDEKQLIRAKNAGASIVLLIVAALPEIRLKELYQTAEKLGLEVLVETHNAEELAIARRIGAKIIGVNNRNLTTFEVTIATSEALAPKEDDHVYISESGFKTKADAERVAKNYQGILVGETLMRSSDLKKTIDELKVTR